MEIRGRLVTTDNPTNLPVVIVTAGSKQIAAAVIVGDYATDTICEHGQDCINLLGGVANRLGMYGSLLKIELGTEAGACARIQMAVGCADDGDIIVFMCGDSNIFDMAWCELNVRD